MIYELLYELYDFSPIQNPYNRNDDLSNLFG